MNDWLLMHANGYPLTLKEFIAQGYIGAVGLGLHYGTPCWMVQSTLFE